MGFCWVASVHIHIQATKGSCGPKAQYAGLDDQLIEVSNSQQSENRFEDKKKGME